jgi:hypothetical protein
MPPASRGATGPKPSQALLFCQEPALGNDLTLAPIAPVAAGRAKSFKSFMMHYVPWCSICQVENRSNRSECAAGGNKGMYCVIPPSKRNFWYVETRSNLAVHGWEGSKRTLPSSELLSQEPIYQLWWIGFHPVRSDPHSTRPVVPARWAILSLRHISPECRGDQAVAVRPRLVAGQILTLFQKRSYE